MCIQSDTPTCESAARGKGTAAGARIERVQRCLGDLVMERGLRFHSSNTVTRVGRGVVMFVSLPDASTMVEEVVAAGSSLGWSLPWDTVLCRAGGLAHHPAAEGGVRGGVKVGPEGGRVGNRVEARREATCKECSSFDGCLTEGGSWVLALWAVGILHGNSDHHFILFCTGEPSRTAAHRMGIEKAVGDEREGVSMAQSYWAWWERIEYGKMFPRCTSFVRSGIRERKKKKKVARVLINQIHKQAPTIDTKAAMSTQVGKLLLIIEQIDDRSELNQARPARAEAAPKASHRLPSNRTFEAASQSRQLSLVWPRKAYRRKALLHACHPSAVRSPNLRQRGVGLGRVAALER
ncbi:hypothetical protein EDB84DRAFT_1435194 [Lactarius hengduanensis]|nr:hypothetical protein EDB84DRAFT_1435194 [Lactarius hengduanensis]